MMKYNEKKGDLFELDNDKYFFAHCISADYKLGAGIAVEFQKKFHLKNDLRNIGNNKYPELLTVDHVFNLVTKKNYWNKPTYDSIATCIQCMMEFCKKEKVKYLAMPRIGSGLDRLQWNKVRDIIKEEFKNLDIEIEVRYL